jgi:hypothetical protein
LFDNTTGVTNDMVSFIFLNFTIGILRIGCLKEWASKELIEFVQLMISYLMIGIQVDSCVITLQINSMNRGCFISYR